MRLPAPSKSGQIVISEIMADPKMLSDAEGEWFELKNTTDVAFDLQGCSLDDGGKALHEVASRVVVDAQAYVTIARNEQPGFKPSYVSSFAFTNTTDTVALRCGTVEIDRVSYDKSQGFAIVSGASLSLDPGQLSAAANDRADAWCAASASYGPELGSPGKPNPPCRESRDRDVNGADAGPAPSDPPPTPEDPAPAPADPHEVPDASTCTCRPLPPDEPGDDQAPEDPPEDESSEETPDAAMPDPAEPSDAGTPAPKESAAAQR